MDGVAAEGDEVTTALRLDLADVLNRYRRAAGETYNTVARRCGVSYSAVNSWMSADRNPGPDAMSRFLRAVGRTHEELIKDMAECGWYLTRETPLHRPEWTRDGG